jgi:antitoxin component of MazEF toxin-antitoxin module
MAGGEMKGETVRWGNSLAVRIPKPAAQKARLSGEGQIELSYAQKVPALGRLVAQITELDRYAEIFRGLELRQGIRGVVTYVPEAGDITMPDFRNFASSCNLFVAFGSPGASNRRATVRVRLPDFFL